MAPTHLESVFTKQLMASVADRSPLRIFVILALVYSQSLRQTPLGWQANDLERAHLRLHGVVGLLLVVLSAELGSLIVFVEEGARLVQAATSSTHTDFHMRLVWVQSVELRIRGAALAIVRLLGVLNVVVLVRHRIVEDSPVLMRFQNALISFNEVIRIEALVVDADLLHLLGVEVELNVSLAVEDLVADWATGDLAEPAVNALLVVYVEAAEHAAAALIRDRLEADHTVVDEVLAIFHSDQDHLYLCVGLLDEPLVNLVVRTCNQSLGPRTSIAA